MFSSTDKLIETLMGYKSIAATLMSDKPEDLQGELANIVIYRLHREDEHLIPSFKERQKKRAAIRAQEIRDGLRVPRKNKKTRAQRLAELSDRERNWRLEMYAEKDRAKRANMTKAERAVYRAKAAARAKASRERNK
jgi:Holliday junction resolvasome RuvABC DNA-binding subunit